jgi:hypothetical protein
MEFCKGDKVKFRTDEKPDVTGFITRVWDKPERDPYVTIRTDEAKPRTFVRCSSAISMHTVELHKGDEIEFDWKGKTLQGTVARVWSMGDVIITTPGAIAGTIKSYHVIIGRDNVTKISVPARPPSTLDEQREATCEWCRKPIRRTGAGADWYHRHNASISCYPGSRSCKRASPYEVV